MRSAAVTTVPRPATLFDRVAEWETLAAFVTDPRSGPAVGIVTGPRRQGKTFLLHELARATGGFYFGAQEATAAESLRHLGDQLARHLGAPYPECWDTWAQALESLTALGTVRPTTVVLDGFPELVRQSPTLPAELNVELRRLGRADRPNRVRLLLCGSAMPVMHRLFDAATTPADLQLELRPPDFRQGALMWGVTDPLLALRVHAVVGSSPAFRYDPGGPDTPAGPDDFDAWVCRTVLDPRLPLFWRAGHLIEQEPDGWDRALCHSVLAALAAGCSTPGAIGRWLRGPETHVPRVLVMLKERGLVAAVSDAFRPGVTHYRITEPLLAFDHAVIRPHRAAFERQDPAEVWRSARAPFESSLLERHFAEVCREWAAGFAAAGTFGARELVTAAPGSLPGVRDAEVVVRDEGRGRSGALLSVGLVRWNEVMDLGHLHQLQQIVAELEAHGEDVSRARPACYGAAGFGPGLRAAANRGELILVDPGRLHHEA
ncbi:ATP-binding protein [Kitasatospora sp. NPDC101155]|uniref:AAA family ATPase n=1 Tax=Kitasatospora sp. NPDC101155 TaxID=3364097 RepID=UPI0037FB5769